MKKIIVAIVAILVLAISYAGFWFFKSYQIKKQISVSASGDSIKYLAGDVAVSGFPLTHKITIKDLKLSDEKSGAITLKHLEVESGMFASEYTIKVLEPIEISTLKPGEEVLIILNPDTKIFATFDDKKEILQVKYSGSGYKVLNKADNAVMFSLECQNCDSEVLVSDKLNTYKHTDAGTKILDKNNVVIATSGLSSFSLTSTEGEDKKTAIKVDFSVKDFEHFDLTPLFGRSAEKSKDSAPEAGSGKSNLVIAGEVVLTPNEEKMIDMLSPEQMATIPNESKAKFQKKASPYSFALNLQNFEISNALYKILIKASLSNYPEEPMPSGSVSLRIENFDNLVKTFTDEMNKFYDENPNKAQDKDYRMAMLGEAVSIIKDLGAKNSQSQEGAPLFDFKRDKGRDTSVTVNEVKFLDVAMQFMMLTYQPKQQTLGQNNDPVAGAN